MLNPKRLTEAVLKTNVAYVAIDLLGLAPKQIQYELNMTPAYVSQLRHGRKPIRPKSRRKFEDLIEEALDELDKSCRDQPKELAPLSDLILVVEKILRQSKGL